MKKIFYTLIFVLSLSLLGICRVNASTYTKVYNYTYDEETSTSTYRFERTGPLTINIYKHDSENNVSYKNTIDLSTLTTTYSNYTISDVRDFVIYTNSENWVFIVPLFNKAYNTETNTTYYLEDLIDIDSLQLMLLGSNSSSTFYMRPTFNATFLDGIYDNVYLRNVTTYMLSSGNALSTSAADYNTLNFLGVNAYIYKYTFNTESDTGTLTRQYITTSSSYTSYFYDKQTTTSTSSKNFSYQVINTMPIYNMVNWQYSSGNYYNITSTNTSDPTIFKEADTSSQVPNVEEMDLITLTDEYSVVFKPKYDKITDSSKLDFVFRSTSISNYYWYQNYEAYESLSFTDEWNKKSISYSNLDLEYKTDQFEFIKAIESSEDSSDSSSSTGSSGGGYSSGGGRHEYYDEGTNTIVPNKTQESFIYYYSEYFDYCVKKYENSQCYYADGTVEDSYFTNVDSTDDYITNLILYFQEQNNYFVAFGALFKYTYYALPGELKTFVVAFVIMFLIYGFISLIRRQ